MTGKSIGCGESERMEGRIVKGIAGFYYVCGEDGIVYECKAKGVFRREHKKPLVGDTVTIDVLEENPPTGNIIQLRQRKNELIRPAVANVDQALIIFAMTDPKPNFQLLDRFLVMMERQDIPCLLCMNKADLTTQAEQDDVYRQYAGAGCGVLFTSAKTGTGMEELRTQLAGKTTTVAGPSGVGKSSIVNGILRESVMETGELSEKIKRGKNTTRLSFFHAVDAHTFLLDTPGFTSLMLPDMEKEELRFYYPEMAVYEGGCRFDGCMHVNEPDCAVKQAVLNGVLPRERYERYVQLYEELWQRRRY